MRALWMWLESAVHVPWAGKMKTGDAGESLWLPVLWSPSTPPDGYRKWKNGKMAPQDGLGQIV